MIEKLTNSEKIVSLLDGELGVEQSKEFYNELSQNESLQSQMNEFIEINKMVRSTRPILPNSAKLGIMAASGFGKSIFTTTGAIISYVGTVIIGTILYFSVFSSEEITEPDLLISEKSGKMTELITTNNSVTNTNNIDPIIERKIAEQSNFQNNNSESKITMTNETGLKVDMKAEVSELISDIRESDILPNVTSEFPVISDVINFGNIFYKSPFSETSSSNFFQNKSIRLMYNGLNSQDIYPNNFAISISTKFSDNFDIGLVFGLENIIQKFEYSNEIETRIYEQNYNAFWGGITAQYTRDFSSGGDFSYYGRGTLGAIKTGPLLRLEFGLQYDMFDGLRIYTGYDAMTTGYSFKNKIFSSNKYGFTFGLDLNSGVFR